MKRFNDSMFAPQLRLALASVFATAINLVLCVNVAQAEPADMQSEHVEHSQGHPNAGHPPPPEAIDACEGLEEGDDVFFTTRRGHELEAVCKYKADFEEGSVLIALPKNGHRPRR